jgi:hypothetical protein
VQEEASPSILKCSTNSTLSPTSKTSMLTPDENRRFWHRGTKIGVIYGLIALVILGITTTQDPEGPLGWLSHKWFERFGLIASLLPLAAASQAYVAGRKDAAISQSDSNV